VRLRHSAGEGLRIEGVSLALDAGRIQPVGIISHAHTDHAAHHKKIVCTPETALLLGERWKRLTVRAVPYGQSVNLENVRVTLHPAGHVLGSAMVLLEVGGTRVLYTGDLRTSRSPLLKPAQPVACDILIVESTFGRPEYVFPAPSRIRQLLHGFVDAARASGFTPVILGYSLGKAQEIVALLAEYHELIWVHPKIARFCALHRQAGIELPEVEVPAAGAPLGALVVMPPNFERTEWRDRISRPRTCFCSGWAVEGARGGFVRADQAIPLSDHDDCPHLVEFARATGARKVFTLHGFAAEFAELLRSEGMDATPISDRWQDTSPRRTVATPTESLDLFES
jgi:putative mRNA 3-end processing factor